MMKNKYLVIIDNLEDVFELKEMRIEKFAFPLKFFSVGFNNYFSLDEIKVDNAYLFINKILDNRACAELKNILLKLPKNIKGVIFDDLGVIKILKNINIEKILYNNHFCTNYESINEFLKYCDTLVISTDITLVETKEILAKSVKSLTVFSLGYFNISYSKRNLLSNYAKYHNLPDNFKLKVTNTDYDFLLIENNEGTVIYDNLLFNGLKYLNNLDNIKYILINSFDIPIKELKSLLNEKPSNLKTSSGFLFKKTIYKLKGEEDV